MGNYANKLLFYTNETRKVSNEAQITEQQTDVEDNNLCTPTLSERRILVDPRSASAGIPRTPIEIKYTPVLTINKVSSAIPKYLQKKQYLETDLDVVMPPLTPKKRVPKLTDSDQSDFDRTQDSLTPNINDKKHSKILTPIDKERFNILGLDPRSPAADFDRTPILIPKSLAKLKTRSHENLTRRGSYDTDMYNPKDNPKVLYQKTCAPYNIPIIQLPDITSKHSEILNIEKCEEPDITSTLQSDFDSTTVSESEAEVTVIKNLKFEKTNTEEKLVSSKQTDKKKDNMDKQDDCEDIEHNIERMHILEDAASSYCEQSLQDHNDKIKVWQDPSSSEESGSGKEEKENVEKLLRRTSPREDIIITFDEHTSIMLSKAVKTGEDYQKKEEIKGKKKKDIKTDTKLVSNEENLFNPGNKYGTENMELFKNRTPLGNRSNNEMQTIARSPKQFLKNKTLSGKVQENTSPYKKYSANARNDIQWDPNSTIFI